MAFNDPIAELLTKLRNAKDAKHRFVDLTTSRLKLWILEILKRHGFIESYLVNQEMRKVRVFLRYTRNRESVLHGLKRISTSGLRRYVHSYQIPRVFNGMGIAIVSTSKGILDGEAAKKLKVGGELLCTVW